MNVFRAPGTARARVAPAVVLLACALPAIPADLRAGNDAAALVAEWPGVYDSTEQPIVGGGEDLRVHLRIERIDLPWLGPFVLYAEEFPHEDPARLKRQRLLRLESLGAGGVRVRQYTFREPGRFRHLHRSALGRAQLTRQDLESDPGCDLVLRREGRQWNGGTEGNACRDASTASERYVDFQLVLGEGIYWYRRRLFTVADNALETEIAGFRTIDLDRARLFTCRVQAAGARREEDRTTLAAADVHDRGGETIVRLPDGRRLRLTLHGGDWPWGVPRDALVLVVREEGAVEPLATGWTRLDAGDIAVDLGTLAVACHAVVPERGDVPS